MAYLCPKNFLSDEWVRYGYFLTLCTLSLHFEIKDWGDQLLPVENLDSCFGTDTNLLFESLMAAKSISFRIFLLLKYL